MLKAAGYVNIVIAAAHIAGLFFMQWMIKVTGITEEMNRFSKIHPVIPYLLTIFVAIVFFIFGLYGLSSEGKFRKLPFLKGMIFFIAGIYIFRGVAKIIEDIIMGTTNLLDTSYSLTAFIIGLLYLFGGLRKWKVKE